MSLSCIQKDLFQNLIGSPHLSLLDSISLRLRMRSCNCNNNWVSLKSVPKNLKPKRKRILKIKVNHLLRTVLSKRKKRRKKTANVKKEHKKAIKDTVKLC